MDAEVGGTTYVAHNLFVNVAKSEEVVIAITIIADVDVAVQIDEVNLSVDVEKDNNKMNEYPYLVSH